MAKIRYRVKPNPKTLKKRHPQGYTVKLAQKPRKGKRGLWIVTPKSRRPAGGSGPGANTPPLPNPAEYDPYGIKKATQYEYGRIDAQLKKHQQWAGDVRKLTESSLQNLYNAREASNTALQERLKGMATTGQTNGNAPQVSGSGGTGGAAVTDPNQGQTNANNVALQQQDKAFRSLAALQGQTALANNTDYIAQHLKGFDYYTGQLPALYNEAKAKYTEQLTNAIMDIEQKKELANIQANASMYGAQQQLMGQLASVQGADNRALIQALSGQYAVDQNNATRIQTNTADNNTRRDIAAEQAKIDWAKIKSDAQSKISTGQLNTKKWHKQMWDAFLKGQPVVDPASGSEAYIHPINGKLLPGAVMAGSELLRSKDLRKQVNGAKTWLNIAVNQLGMNKKQAAQYLYASISGNRKHRGRVLRAAGVYLGWN